MSADEIRSKAFSRAALKSESYRTLGVLVFLAALVIYGVVRGIVSQQFRLLLVTILIALVAVAYEWYMFSRVNAAIRDEKELPKLIWLVNVLIETQIPTLVLFLLIRSKIVSPYVALIAPAVLFYFYFVILSTLRLSRVLSILTGVFAGLGYLAVILFALSSEVSPENETPLFPITVYFLYAGIIAASGVVAAFVAGQIRNHVNSALREAELQSQLERVNHDLDVARSIQQGLLPTTSPGLEDFEIAGWNQPADQTGGDYFDWQQLPDGRIAISLADATGHGIGPALISSSCRAYARATLLADGHGDAVLDRLNVLLAEDLPSNRFLTYALIFLEPKSSKVQVLSAGHGPILWYKRGSDEMRSLDAQGIPLGMISGIEYGNATEGVLAPGDMLALATDGFFEWENPVGEQFGIPRMEAVLREARDAPAEEVIVRLRNAVEEFCEGTKQMDDLTAVILKRRLRG